MTIEPTPKFPAISFTAPLAAAILAGEKTRTLRVIPHCEGPGGRGPMGFGEFFRWLPEDAPKGQAPSLLTREELLDRYRIKAGTRIKMLEPTREVDGQLEYLANVGYQVGGRKWKPGFLQRYAHSRAELEVKSVELVQARESSREDIDAEGIYYANEWLKEFGHPDTVAYADRNRHRADLEYWLARCELVPAFGALWNWVANAAAWHQDQYRWVYAIEFSARLIQPRPDAVPEEAAAVEEMPTMFKDNLP